MSVIIEGFEDDFLNMQNLMAIKNKLKNTNGDVSVNLEKINANAGGILINKNDIVTNVNNILINKNDIAAHLIDYADPHKVLNGLTAKYIPYFTSGGILANTQLYYDDITGLLTMEGSTRVKKNIWMPITTMKAPGIKPATLVDYGIGDAWEFTDGTDDTVVTRIEIPEDMDISAGIEIFIGWNTPTANAGNCKWDIEYLFRKVNEEMDAAADATLTATVAASATAKGLVASSIGTTAVPHVDDICITIRVKRRADEAADTLGEDNHLFGVCFRYVANKLGKSL